MGAYVQYHTIIFAPLALPLHSILFHGHYVNVPRMQRVRRRRKTKLLVSLSRLFIIPKSLENKPPSQIIVIIIIQIVNSIGIARKYNLNHRSIRKFKKLDVSTKSFRFVFTSKSPVTLSPFLVSSLHPLPPAPNQRC